MAQMTPWGQVLGPLDDVPTAQQLASQRQALRKQTKTQGLGQFGMPGRVVLRSQITPDVVYDPSAPAAPPQEGRLTEWFLRNVVKPELTIQTAAGEFSAYAPYGKPTHNYFPLLMILGAGGAFFLGRWVWRGITAPR
jgi:hypothetical protein